MISINLLDSILAAWKINHTRKGLFYIFVIWNIILVGTFGIPMGVLKFLGTPLKWEIKIQMVTYAGLTVILSNLIILIIWKYFTGIPNYLASDIGIIFAPHYDLKCNELISNLYRSIKEDYKTIFKQNNIKFRLLPENFKINSSEEANEVLNNSKSYLIIHGLVDKDKLNSENVEGFKQISFTIKNKANIDCNSDPLLKDVTHALAFRKFLIKENNAFVELEVVKTNLKECSIFFLALSLMLEGENNQALPFIASLYNKVANFRSDNPSWNRFKEIVEELYTICLESMYKYTFYKYVNHEVTNRDMDPYAQKCKEYIDILVQIRKREHPYHLSLAILDFHFGNYAAVSTHLKRAKQFAPQTDPAPDISMGFIHLWIGEYRDALREYKLAIAKNELDNENYAGIHTFLEGLKSKFPDRHELKFATGLLLENYCDEKLGKQEYRDFLRHSREGSEMVFLFDYARKRIEKPNLPPKRKEG